MPTTYRLPAEWARQSAVQLTWPHDQGDWEGNLAPARACFTRIAACLSEQQTVLVVARDEQERRTISQDLHQAGAKLARCRFVLAPSDDSWARDHSPLTVDVAPDGTPDNNSGLRLLKFRFNGWGGRYPASQDDALAWRLKEAGAFGDTPMVQAPLVLEGGAIETDGAGQFLLRRSCIVDEARNSGMDSEAMAAALGRWLGAETIHWLDQGDLAGDDTDGHIDTLARFGPSGQILYQGCSCRDDEHFNDLQAMAGQLTDIGEKAGLEPVALPLPQPLMDSQGRRMPAGYANFLVANRQVLVPTYEDPHDAEALALIAEAFPDHQVVGLDCRALVRQGGSLHCVTMQYPEGVVPPDAGLPAIPPSP